MAAGIEIAWLRTAALLSCCALCGCTPLWSVRLDEGAAAGAERMAVVDQRPADEKQFRFQDFLKRSYRSYLGDSNTTPDRISVLRTHVNRSALASEPVLVRKFDILQDLSGGAPTGVVVVGGTPVASDVRGGDDYIECTLVASYGGREFTAQTHAQFRPGALDGPNGKPMAAATQRCIDEAINGWIAQASGTP